MLALALADIGTPGVGAEWAAAARRAVLAAGMARRLPGTCARSQCHSTTGSGCGARWASACHSISRALAASSAPPRWHAARTQGQRAAIRPAERCAEIRSHVSDPVRLHAFQSAPCERVRGLGWGETPDGRRHREAAPV